MGLIACPHCLKDIYDGVETCPHCGGPISRETIAQGEQRLKEGFHSYVLKKENSWFIASIVVGILAALMVIVAGTQSGAADGALTKLYMYAFALFAVLPVGSFVYLAFCVHLYFGMKNKSIIGWILFFAFIYVLEIFTLFILSTFLIIRAIYKRVKKQPVFSEEFVISRCV